MSTTLPVGKVLMRGGGKLVNVIIVPTGDEIRLSFGFNAPLKDHIKALDGARWNPGGSCWTVKNNEHNRFQLAYLAAINPEDSPYYKYNIPLIPVTPSRKLYHHQVEMLAQIITRRACILACEMGTGKTLAAIEGIEYFSKKENLFTWWYIAPNSVLAAIRLEFRKWGLRMPIKLITYDSLYKEVAGMKVPPRGAIFDEASRLKNPSSRRTQAAMELVTKMREQYGNPPVILMTGTPAPKNPTDWWSLCEVACPGFLKEGNTEKLKNTLAIWESCEGYGGQSFRKLVTWLDDTNKCRVCGEMMNNHKATDHIYLPSVNEVLRLGIRMKGLTIVQMKKDCLDLPDKVYRIIECPLSQEFKNVEAALRYQLTGIKLLEALRELSDGFQYVETPDPDGTLVTCQACNGSGTIDEPDEAYNPETAAEDEAIPTHKEVCKYCNGSGRVVKTVRTSQYVGSPKEQVLKDLLDEYSDIQRAVIFCAYHASLEIVRDIVVKEGWDIIVLYGGGCSTSLPNVVGLDRMLEAFQSDMDRKIAFISIPGSGGMGITLSKSPVCIHYSNSFDAEGRQQSDDRIHRPGMDVNLGATIIDIFHLKTDRYVYDNLMKKRDLQKVSMEELRKVIEDGTEQRTS